MTPLSVLLESAASGPHNPDADGPAAGTLELPGHNSSASSTEGRAASKSDIHAGKVVLPTILGCFSHVESLRQYIPLAGIKPGLADPLSERTHEDIEAIEDAARHFRPGHEGRR